MAFGIVAALIASIIVANAIGPTRLGNFNYVLWLTTITASVGATGLAITTRKYMAEYLSQDEPGVARAIYFQALKIQALLAFAVTAVGVALVLVAGDPGEHLVSILLILNMAPRMIGFIPSQANNAAEMMKRNTGPSLLGGIVNVALTLFSVWMGWNLVGIALALLAGALLDTLLKLYSVARWLAPVRTGVISPELKRRMFSYSGQGIVLMVLNIVVWDKSDAMVLKWMNSDIRQVTFFTMAFGLTERLQVLPNIFAGSLSVTMMAQFGRSEERVREIAVIGTKYALLLGLPLLVGLACISRLFVLRVYRPEYEPMALVLTIAALMAVPKSLISAPTTLLQTVEKQGFLIWTGCLCGVVDIGLDVLLIPSYGALGAALANGSAQTLAAVMIWTRVYREFQMDLRLAEFGKITASGALMAGVVLLVQYLVPISGYPGIAMSVAAGAIAWFGALRLTGALNRADGERLLHIGRLLPGGLRPVLQRCVRLLATEAAA